MHAADSTPSTPIERPRQRRRTLLLVSACSLLAIGIGINAHRYMSRSAEPLAIDITDDQLTDNRFVEHINQPDDYIMELKIVDEEADDDEAGGQGQRHKGEEGKMGRPTSKQESGLYAMKGPRNVVPQLARSYDPEMMGRNAGILGLLSQESGHYLASPYGAAYAVDRDDRGRPSPGHGVEWDAETYDDWQAQAFTRAEDDSVSTFSIDVDTGSYSLVRQSLLDDHSLPAPPSVRVEEMINYFEYAYPEPGGPVPMSITSEVGPCPWNDEHRLVHVGLQGKHIDPGKIPPRNLVFLVDVSGSMGDDLSLVVSSLTYLAERLDQHDRISLVVYAGAAGVVLPPTAGSDKNTILRALERLQAGGSTNGGEGIHLAYRLAEQSFVEGGINRVVLATDGDFNVGVTGQDALVELIEQKRRSGVFLSVLGFGQGNYQDATMEQLADKGNGNYAYIDGLAEARKVLVEQAGSTLVTIAKDVKIQVDFDPAKVERYRLLGYTNRILADRDFADDTKDAGEVGAGHTVTALYEIEPKHGADGDALMQLRMRYKQPDGHRSKLVEVPVDDRGAELPDTSDDFRFSAAVAGFGQVLQGVPTKEDPGSLEALRDLAAGARGADRHCWRAELVQLVERASYLRGRGLASSRIECVPSDESEPVVYDEGLEPVDAPPEPPKVVKPEASEEPTVDDTPEASELPVPTRPQRQPFDWAQFVKEVLYLLPPLLALPLFVLALRRRRWDDEWEE